MDFNRLVKILNLTQSDQDNEALAAIRTANKLLCDNEFNWEEIISIKPKTSPKVTTGEYDWAFEALFKLELPQSTSDFILSLFEFYQAKRYLTAKQKATLQNILDRYQSNKPEVNL